MKSLHGCQTASIRLRRFETSHADGVQRFAACPVYGLVSLEQSEPPTKSRFFVVAHNNAKSQHEEDACDLVRVESRSWIIRRHEVVIVESRTGYDLVSDTSVHFMAERNDSAHPVHVLPVRG